MTTTPAAISAPVWTDRLRNSSINVSLFSEHCLAHYTRILACWLFNPTPLNRYSPIKGPGPMQRTIVDESHGSIAHACRKTIPSSAWFGGPLRLYATSYRAPRRERRGEGQAWNAAVVVEER